MECGRLNKKVFSYFLLGFLLLSMLAPVVFDNVPAVKGEDVHIYRRKIDINASPYISADVANVPVQIKFNSTDHADLFDNGEDGDSVKFTSDEAGTTQLAHECVRFGEDDAIFYVKVDLDNDSQYTPIYFWYGTPAITGTESKTNVWTNGKAIYHLENNANDSMGSYNGTVYGATYTSSGYVGGCYEFDGTNDYIDLNDVDLTSGSFTIVTWVDTDAPSAGKTIIGKTSSDGVTPNKNYFLLTYSSKWRIAGSTNSVDSVSSTSVATGWKYVGATYSSTTLQLMLNGSADGSSVTSNVASTNYDASIGRPGEHNGWYWDGHIDEVWLFNDAKSADWFASTYNNVQNYSTFVTIDGAVDMGNSAPNKPTITRIGSVATNASNVDDEDASLDFLLTLKGYNSSDPDGDDQSFRWTIAYDYADLYTTPDYNMGWKNDNAGADINISFTDDINKKNTMYFGLTAKDPDGETNSTFWKMTVINNAPTAVTLSTPADSSSTRDTTPTFTWSLASPEDADGDNVFYAVLVYDGEGNLDANSGYKDGNTTYTVAGALDVDDYEWKVVAYDKYNNSYYDKTNSSVRDLSIVTNSAPNIPTITSVGGVTDVNGTVFDENTGASAFLLNLKGYNSSDPDGDNMSHRWSWSTDYATLFTTTTSNSSWLDNPADINSSTITSALARNTYWYIGLESKDDYAGAKSHSHWKVYLDNKAPTAGTLSAPADSSETYDTTPTFEWGVGSDDDGDTLTMQVKVYDASGNLDYNNTFGSGTSATPAGALDLGTYTWRVRYFDGYDYTNSSDWTVTIIENTIPNKPTITSIGNSNVNATIYDEDSGAGFQITRKGYNSSDYDGDVQKFKWEVDNDSDFSSPLITVDNLASGDVNGTFTTPLVKNNYYYFRLGAIDPLGANDYNYSNPIFKMYIGNRVPSKPVVTAPSGETYDTTPNITWNASTDGDGDDFNYCVVVKDTATNVDYNSGYLSTVTSPHTVSTPLDLDSYSVYVYVYDGYDSNVSEAGSFKVIANTPPNKAVINTIGGVASGNNMYDEDSGAGFKLTMDGTNSSDYDGDAQKWAWIIDDDSGFGSIDYNSTYDTPIDVIWTTALQKNKTWYFRVDAIDPLGSATVNSSATFTGTMENYAPNAVTPSTPADSSTTYDTTPEFTWTLASPEDDDGDNVYYAVLVYDGEGNLDFNSGFEDGIVEHNATALDLDTYTWKVVAYDNDGTYYYDKTNSSVRTLTIIENTIPNKPTITSIGGETTNTTIYDEDSGATFQITVKGYNSSDYDGDNQTFKWEVDNNSNFGSPEISLTDIESDINTTLTDSLTKKVDYYFRLGAIDPAGANEYNYSSPIFKMTLGNRYPSKPVVTAPLTTTYDTTPAITWTNSSDIDGDTLTYRVEISNASGVVRQSAWGVSQPYTNSTALSVGDYNITITAYDGYDTNASANELFTVIANTPPNKVTIDTIGGETNSSLIYDEDTADNGFQITLNATNSSDFDGDNQLWAWIISEDSGFASIDYNTTFTTPLDTTFTTTLTKNKVWYFRVDAIDPLGSGTYNSSLMWKETLMNRSPTKPVVTAPSGETYDSTPSITWDASTDGDGDTLTYRVEISNASGVVRQSAWTATSGYPNATALDLGDYNATVIVNDGTETNSSSVSSFTVIGNTIPNKPTITTIGGEASESTIYDEDSGAGFQITVKGYNSSDYDGDVQKFKWEVDNDSDFSSPLFSIDTLSSADINRTMTTALTKNAYYWFRLGAIDPAGANDYNYSTAFYMYLENKAPTAGTLSSPTDASTTYDTTPTFEWTAGSDDDGDTVTKQVKVYDASGNLDYNNTFGSDLTATSGVLDLGTYTWRVRYYDGYDYTNSSDYMLTIIENTAPNKAVITTVAGEVNASIIYDQDSTAGFKIVLNGTNSSDPDGDAQKWAWIIDDNADFGSIDYNSGYVTPIDYDWTTALTKNKVWYFRVDAIDPLGSGEANVSGMYKYTLNNKVPTAGSLTSPTDSATTYDTTPTFEWGVGSDDDGDTLTMQVKVYDSEGNLDYNNTFGALTTATPAGALDLGAYTWLVRYYDGYAYTNSSTWSFTLIANTAPLKPTITLIGGSDTNGSTIYDTDAGSGFAIALKGYNSSDPDGDDQSFGWLIDDDSAFGSLAYDTRWFASHGDINVSMTTALTKKTWYYFRLDAKDPLGSDTVASSLIRKHYVGNYVPSAPVVTAPTTTTSDTTPNITWTNSSDIDGDALTYRVEISNASGVVRQSAWGVSQPYTNSTALSVGEYNVTIYVYDTYDTNSSAVGSFTIVPNWRPNAPTITSVAGASTNSTVYDQDPTANVLWELRGYNSSDLDGDAQEFLWQIDNNSNFGSPEYSATGLAMGDINRSMTTALNRNTSYYVRLGAKDPLGSNTYNYSNILLLLFENYAPTAGSLTAPDDSSTTCDTTVFMSWGTGTDGDGDPLTMQVRVYDSLGNKDYNNTFGADVNATTGVLTADTYTWKVVYYDGYDYTNSSARTFTVVDNTMPSVPTLSTPANFAKDINPATVTLDWADSTDACGDSITYTVQWSTSYTFTTYQEATSGTSSYAITSELYTEQVYYWRVKATDVIGSTAWSSIYEFQTESASGGSGSDQYEVRANGAYDKDSGRVEVVVWIQKNGVMMTGITDVSVVMKDDANTTVHTFNSGTVYSDGFYRETWTTTGLHGIYSLKTTLTYSGNTYYGGSYFDAGIMEIHDALTSMTVTIGVIQGHVDTLETNVNATYADVVTIKGYVGTPADTSANNTLFGYSQFLKDKWGSYTAEQIYNKVDDVYDLVVDINSTDIAYLRSTLDDLDTYVRTYAGVDIAVGSSYDFYNDQLEISIAYVHDGDIKSTTSCTTVLKDSDGTVLKTFTSADGADDIYRYAWNSSAVDYPTNGFTGAYTIIPSVVYNGDTFTTVSTFNAELPDLYGVTTYDDDLVPYMDSGYSVEATSVVAGSYLYVKGTGDGVTLPNLSSVSWTLWWEDSYSNVLATSTGTGAISSNTLRMPVTVPSGLNGVVHLRLYAYKTTYGHRMSEISGVSDDFTVTPLPIGSGLPRAMVNCEIRECPDTIDYGREIPLSLLFSRVMYVPDGKEPVAFDIKIKSGDAPVVANGYTLLVGKTPEATLVKVPTKSNVLKAGGVFTVEVSSDGTVLDTQQIAVQKGKVTDYGWLLDPLDFPEVGVIIIPVFGGVSVLHLLLCLIILLLLKAGDSKR